MHDIPMETLAPDLRPFLPLGWTEGAIAKLSCSENKRDTIESLLIDAFQVFSKETNGMDVSKIILMESKDKHTACEWKDIGNECFKTRRYEDAIKFYTHGLRALVVNSDDAIQLQAILYTNRCAAWHELLSWRNAIEDASSAIISFPTYAKAWFRRGKSIEKYAMSNSDACKEICINILQDERDIPLIVKYHMIHAQALAEGTATTTIVPTKIKDDGPSRQLYHRQQHDHVHVHESKELGRSLFASQTIPSGTVILTEDPNALTMYPSQEMRCARCTKIFNLIPCNFCNHSMYCSTACRSLHENHKYECGLPLPGNLTALLAWRLLNSDRFSSTQPILPAKNMQDIRQLSNSNPLIIQLLASNPHIKMWLGQIGFVVSHDKDMLWTLFEPSTDRVAGFVSLQPQADQSIHIRWYVLPQSNTKHHAERWLQQLQGVIQGNVLVFHAPDIIASQAALCCKFCHVVGNQYSWIHQFNQSLQLQSQVDRLPSIKLVETIISVAALSVADPWRNHFHYLFVPLVLRRLFDYACQLPTNVVGITANSAVATSQSTVDTIVQGRLALGVFPMAAMINHSCAPNAFIRFDDATLSIVTTVDISKGDDIFISYGPHASKMKRTERKDILHSQYYFECCCRSCLDEDIVNNDNFLEKTIQVEAKLRQYLSNSQAFPQGESLAKELLASRIGHLPTNHLLIGRGYDMLAEIAAMQNNYLVAFEYCKKSIEILETKYNPLDAELGHEYLKAVQVARIDFLDSQHLFQLLFHGNEYKAIPHFLAKANSSLSLHLPKHDPVRLELDEFLSLFSNHP